jgi:F-type H+-transporting ATPase subunit epsilon
MTMRLRILLPTRVLVDAEATKLVAEARNGYFCLLPRHASFVAALVPGILAHTDVDGAEHFVAVDEGMLVKRDRDVLVSVMDGMTGVGLDTLRMSVDEHYRDLGDDERRARNALARLEAGALRRLFELERIRHA